MPRRLMHAKLSWRDSFRLSRALLLLGFSSARAVTIDGHFFASSGITEGAAACSSPDIMVQNLGIFPMVPWHLQMNTQHPRVAGASLHKIYLFIHGRELSLLLQRKRPFDSMCHNGAQHCSNWATVNQVNCSPHPECFPRKCAQMFSLKKMFDSLGKKNRKESLSFSRP